MLTDTRQMMIAAPAQESFSYLAALFFLDGGHYLFRSNGVSKFVTSRDVAAAFSDREEDTGWLPAGVVRCGHCAKGNYFVYSAPAQKVAVVIREQTLTIPIPRTLLVGVGTVHYLFALTAQFFSRNENVFRAPFPNVHQSGQICWGSNQAPESKPGEARKIWERFFGTPFNHDLVNGKSAAQKVNVVHMLESLAGKNKYPVSDLIEHGGTVDRVVTNLLERGQ